MTKISVIVPVYNAEKYLQRCVDSILAQIFTDFELILVDDGSLDNSGKICDTYAEKDHRVRVIHQPNRGVACARNSALDIVEGKYITFCDSDDSWEPILLSEAYREMKKYRADCVTYNYVMFKEKQDVVQSNFWPGVFNLQDDEAKVDYLIKILLSYKHGYEVWNHLFKRDIIEKNNIRFCTECGDFGEDVGFVFKYLCYAKIVYCSEKKSYNYFVNKGSIMDQSKAKIRLNELNEVCYDIEKIYCAVFQKRELRKQFSIIHFLIMNQQYSKMVFTSKYSELGSEIKKIERTSWYKKQVKGLGQCYEKLCEYYGTKVAKQIILFSKYCLHTNWKRFSIESLIFYKWIIR